MMNRSDYDRSDLNRSSSAPVVGLFRTYDEAQNAVDLLEQNGFTRNEISIAARDRTIRERMGNQYNTVGDNAAKGAVSGGVLGGLAGLLAGLGAIAIPGIGPVIAAGTLAATLTATAAGAGIGAAAGGLLGALTEMGIPEEEAQFYSEGVKRGGVLITVHSNRTNEAKNLLHQAGAVDVQGARMDWERQGWKHFDDTTNPGDDYPKF